MSLAYCIGLHILLTLPWDSLMPIMITRLILSLKKAVNSPNSVSSGPGRLETVRLARCTVGGTERVRGGDVALRDLSSEGTSDLSRSDD